MVEPPKQGLARRILTLPYWYVTRRFASLQDHVDDRLNQLGERVDEALRKLDHLEGKIALDPEFAERAAPAIRGLRLSGLGQETAATINWAIGHEGFASQAGVWFNPPVNVQLRRASVETTGVNERIVEVPFAMGVASSLALGSPVLDVGSNESTFALSLASLGLRTTAIDPRGYPLSHPNLTVVESGLDEWAGPTEPLRAIFCISTVEHVGLAAYNQGSADLNADALAIGRFREWLAPEGELVLTTPYGTWSVSDFERTYDDEHLDSLLAGWTVLERRVYVRSGPLLWGPAGLVSPLELHEQDAVVLLRATP